MANVIKHKRGSGSDPVANNLVIGELAIRTDNGKLFTKMDSGAIAEIAGGGSDIAINTLSSSSATGGGSATFNGSAYRFTLSSPPSVSAAQLLVSVNGVIQKPVAGTGQPSEGFSVSGSDIIFGDAPATGADFFILTFRSLGVSEPADNSVTSAKIVDGTITGSDLATNIDLVDNQKIRFGTGNDLQIYHDGSSSYVDHVGIGNLFIRGNDTNAISLKAVQSKNSLICHANAQVQLYHNNSLKFETTSTGATITGSITVTNDIVLQDNLVMGDTDKIQLGDSVDLQIYHDGTASFIKNTTGGLNLEDTGGYFRVKSDDIKLEAANGEDFLECDANGAVSLYYDAAKKFETTSNGATVSVSSGDPQLIVTGPGHALLQLTSTSGTDHCGVNFGDNDDNNAGMIQYTNSTNAMQFHANGSERMRIDSSGNVGINETSPETTLHVENDNAHSSTFYLNTDATILAANKNTAGTRKTVLKLESDAAIVYGGPGGTLIFSDRQHERMRINSSGCVSIGTTDNSVAFNDVQGISLDGANGYLASNRNNNESFGFGRGNAGRVGRFFNAGTAVGRIVITSNSTSYETTGSDRSLKKNFEPWNENTLSLFKNINPQKFNFIQEEDGATKSKGFIAQELANSFPEAYSKGGEEDDKYWFNPSGMVVYLMKAIQELTAKVEALEAK